MFDYDKKYYKIISKSMVHHWYVFEEGLNIDCKPFIENSDYDCPNGGGIYFSDMSNILSHTLLGELLFEVTIPPNAKVAVLEDKYRANMVILKKIGHLYDIDTLKFICDNGANIDYRDDIITQAILIDRLDIIEYLYSIKKYSDSDMIKFLTSAIIQNNVKIAKYFIDLGSTFEPYAIQLAVAKNNVQMLLYLSSIGIDLQYNMNRKNWIISS